MASNFGWKDILRPIRDGFRHVFPSPDTGPTPEERRAQRECDRLKGFTYFDIFEQLVSWSESESDPIQRANTPLLPRSKHSAIAHDGRSKVLLCHDYSGNYHDYESVQGVGIEEERYTCEFLNLVDIFVYFSHKLVCVPPPSWTNTLHRNGVKALGVLLVEPQTEHIEKLLEQGPQSNRDEPHFLMATKLAAIARHHDIDGWLVNIEKPFPTPIWDAHRFTGFLQQLRSNLGKDRHLIWYDALIISNKISYQNGLTYSNLSFVEACGSVLTNYSWKEDDAESTKQIAQQHNLPLHQIFLGIDVWAQNPSSFTHPRVTYPEKNGGGTNTGMAVTKLAEVGLSSGIFAPGWSFEHFPGHGRAIEHAVWEGHALPKEFECSCGDLRIRHPQNAIFPIVKSADDFPSGSQSFFYTDFSRGFGKHGEHASNLVFDGRNMHSQVGSQAPLPLVAHTRTSPINTLSYELQDLADRTQLVVNVHNLTSSEIVVGKFYESWLPLFRLDMPADGSLQLTILSKTSLLAAEVEGSFYVRLGNNISYVPFGEAKDIEHHLVLNRAEESRVEEIGIFVRAPYLGQENIQIVQVFEICIAPRCLWDFLSAPTIDNVRIEDRGEGENKHKRLCWTFTEDKVEAEKMVSQGLPYSVITGLFSHFVVQIDDLAMGRAYALEYVFSRELMESWAGREVKVAVTGFGFDGRKRATTTSMLGVSVGR